MEVDVPRQMRAVVTPGTNADPREAVAALRVVTREVPAAGPGQVLVKMSAAPCNPADLLFLEGRYGVTREFPAVLGFEGAGEVVAAGPGILGRWLVGKRVICGGHDSSGTWAEYCVASATSCLPLRRDLSLEQGATAVANPVTAIALVSLSRAGRHRGVVQTAAAGQLGRMVFSLAREAGLSVINVVRRAASAEPLRALGAECILESSAEDFDATLQAECERRGATIALDAVGGAMTGRLVAALPTGGEVVVYGALSGDPCGGIDPMQLAFGEKRVRGFEVAAWLRQVGLFRAWRVATRAQRLVAAGTVTTTVARRTTLDDAREALLGYLDDMSGGKILICP